MHTKIININKLQLNKQFFKEFLNSLNSIKENEKIMIGLSGGSSVSSFYTYIKDNYLEIPEEIREKIYYCFLDERVVPLDDNDSNYNQLKKEFLDDLIKNKLLSEESIIKIDLKSPDIAKDYFQRVKHIDIWLFWVWPDWHTCSLFPNNILLDDEIISYLQINDSPKPPSKRITISKNLLKKIEYSFIFFIWEWKKEAYLNFLDKSLSYKQAPTKIILDCENSYIVSDIIK